MKKRVAPRIARTTKMIMKSLRKLASERGLDGITIKEITETAKVNRTTFYYHYRDKNDLIEKTLIEDFKVYLLNPIMECEKMNEGTLRMIYFALIKYIETISIYCQGDFSYLHSELTQKMTDQLIEQLQLILREDHSSSDEYLRFSAVILSSSIVGLIREWMANDQLEVEQLIDSTTPILLNIVQMTEN